MSEENSSLLLLSLVAILVIALSVNYSIYQRQERNRQRAILVKKVRYDAEQLLETLSILKHLQCPKPVLALLNNEVVDILARLARLKPQSGVIEQLQSQIPRAPEQPQSLDLENASTLKKAQNAIRITIRFIHQLRSRGALSSLKCDELSKELQWFSSKIEIDTHTDAGTQFLKSDKAVLAVSRFKLAKGIIARLSHKEPKRQILMDEINQLIAEASVFGTPSAATEAKTARNNENSNDN
ncbi:MAG: hypothetical protein ACI9W6_003047 [Motiliproteus sp.]|jgi:hypothetical protein